MGFIDEDRGGQTGQDVFSLAAPGRDAQETIDEPDDQIGLGGVDRRPLGEHGKIIALQHAAGLLVARVYHYGVNHRRGYGNVFFVLLDDVADRAQAMPPLAFAAATPS